MVFFILVPAVIVLWGAPGHTDDLWSWTIAAKLTPIFLGSGYGAGAYFFWRTYRASRWHPSSAGALGASIFAGLMLIATLIDFDVFNKGDAPFLAAVAFYGWTVVYVLSPFAVLWLWLRNQRTDPRRPDPGEPHVSATVRLGARMFAGGAFVAAAVAFVAPSVAIDIWPWDLTDLTARVIASFTAQVGVGALMLSLDERWTSWRLLIQTFFVATALLLIGAAREFSGFDEGNPLTWVYLGGLIGADLGLLMLYLRMERRRAET